MSAPIQITVGMHEAKSRLSELVRKALEDNVDVIITQRNKPVMRLVPYEEPPPRNMGFGSLKGKIHMEEDFQETPQDIIDSFYGDGITEESSDEEKH